VAGAIGAGALALALVLSDTAVGAAGQAGRNVHPLSCNDGTGTAPAPYLGDVASPDGGCPGMHTPMP
jgi:hypothetical protein